MKQIKTLKMIPSKILSNFNATFILSIVSMILSAVVIFSLALTIMASKPVMMAVGMYSIPDVEISNVMYANAEVCGVDRETFQAIIEDEALKQLMVSASIERIEALLMRRDVFSATTESLQNDIGDIISTHIALDKKNLSNLSQYVFYLTGTQTVASDFTPEEYRHSAYVLGEKLDDEALVEMDEAYSILAFLMNGQFAVLSMIIWLTFLSITVFLGRKEMQETIRGLYYRHYPVALLGVAVSIGFLVSNWKGLGIIFQTFFICLGSVAILFFALESGASAMYFRVIYKGEHQETAKKNLRQNRRLYRKQRGKDSGKPVKSNV